MSKLRQIDGKTWVIEGASMDEVHRATKQASQEFGPIDEGPLPWPMKMMLKGMVALQTHDEYDDANRRGAKVHNLGPDIYRTTVTLRWSPT